MKRFRKMFPDTSRSFTGAWIETEALGNAQTANIVAPSRERGLKRWYVWKQSNNAGRSFTGAWIETIKLGQEGNNVVGRSFTGAWIETECLLGFQISKWSLLHGSVD